MSRRAYTLLILNYYLRLFGLPAIFAIVMLAIIVRQHNFVLAILSLKLLMQRIHWNALVCCAALRRCCHVLIRTCGSTLRSGDGLLWVAIDYNDLGLVLLWARLWLLLFSLTAFFCLAWMPASLCRLVQAVLLQLILAILERPLRQRILVGCWWLPSVIMMIGMRLMKIGYRMRGCAPTSTFDEAPLPGCFYLHLNWFLVFWACHVILIRTMEFGLLVNFIIKVPSDMLWRLCFMKCLSLTPIVLMRTLY